MGGISVEDVWFHDSDRDSDQRRSELLIRAGHKPMRVVHDWSGAGPVNWDGERWDLRQVSKGEAIFGHGQWGDRRKHLY